MIAMAEIAAGVYGAWLLARRNAAGLNFFDLSERGFFRSFWAAVVVLPAFLVLEILEGSFSGPNGALRPLLVQGIAYVIGWTAFPVVMVHIAEAMGRRQNYIRYIVAYNWSAVIQMMVFLPVALLGFAFPGAGTAMAGLAVFVLILIYQAYVAHKALDVSPAMAAGVVLADMLIGETIRSAATALGG